MVSYLLRRTINASFLILFVFSVSVYAQQIVHIESRRIAEIEDGFSATIDMQLNYIRNKHQIFQTFNSLHTRYGFGDHTFLFLAGYNFGAVDGGRIINDSYQHIRYTRIMYSRIAGEVFVQSQHNEGILLQWRGLAGIGPRFTVMQNERSRLYVGTLYMYEYEQERPTGNIYRVHRLSNYISFGMPLADFASFDAIMYYQPALRHFANYKYSSEATLEIRLRERFALITSFGLTHNTRPPEGIQRTNIHVRNGIRFVF